MVRQLAAVAVVTALSVAPDARAQASSPVFGDLNVPIGINADNTITVWGWAATSDYPQAAIGVRIRIGTAYYFPASNYRLANLYRQDVATTYPGYGGYHGFMFLVPAPRGNLTVCLEGQNSGVYNTIDCEPGVFVSGSSVVMRFRGGLWQQIPTQTLPLTYGRGTTWQSDIDTGEQAWNPATRVDLITANPANANVNYFTLNTNSITTQFIAGLTGFDPWTPTVGSVMTDTSLLPHANRTYSHNNIWLNMGNPDMSSSALRREVASHEMGHAVGLAHPPNPGVPTVMHGDYTQGASSTQTFDMNSINSAYTSFP